MQPELAASADYKRSVVGVHNERLCSAIKARGGGE